jgi:diguanylate cyclase (GGDEF)-like protein
MLFPRSIRRSIGRTLALAAGLPVVLLAVAGALWLRRQAAGEPAPSPTGIGLGLVGFAVAAALTHALAVRLLVERPLRRLGAGLRRARQGGFLGRLEAQGDDEVADLARTFNATLAAITDLHAQRIDDQAERSALQRELALKSELEARVGELELLHRLAGALAELPDVDGLVRRVAELAGTWIPGTAVAVLLLDEATRELTVRAVAGLDPTAVGTRYAAEGGLAGRAMAERRPALARGEAAAAALLGAGGPASSAVAVPLLLHPEGCAGAMIFGRAGPPEFQAAELRLFESAARQTATALEGARLHQAMIRLSQTDTLTGVQNRRQLFARLELERERAARFGEPFALLLLDVDRFRDLNAAAGHAAGDAALREVAALLGREVRAVDLVARYGGEEFAVVLPRMSPPEAWAAAERLRQAVAGSRFEGAPGGRLTVSVGGACFPGDARDLATLVDCADAALFAAKRAGRDASRLHVDGMRADPGRRRDIAVTGKV